jgi:tRNA A37 threonylcarbamoyladenosine dehydratase
MNNLNNKNIVVIGLGKLGSYFTTSFAYEEFKKVKRLKNKIVIDLYRI